MARTISTGRTYTWNVMQHPDDVEFAPAPTALVEMARTKKAVAPIVAYRPTMQSADLELAEHVVSMLRGKLRRRFQRDARGLRDTSPSGVDASLAALAALAGLAPEHVAAVVRASRAAAGLPPKGTRYFASTVGKALRIAQDSGERSERLASVMFGGLPHA